MDGVIFKIYRYFVFTVMVSSLACSGMAAYKKINSKRIPKIKVLVGKSLKNFSIVGTDLRRYLYPKKELKRYTGRKEIRFNCENVFSKRKGRKNALLLASLRSPTGLITYESDKYQGRLLVLTSPNHKSCDIVNEIDLESYIAPLLSKEMNDSWPIEALKAQAVAARTYAVDKINSRKRVRKFRVPNFYDLENSEKHQVSGNFFDATKKTILSTKETKGEILITKKSSRIVPVFFHAESGGKTLLPEVVWNNYVEGYTPVKMPYKESKWKWKKVFSSKEFISFLKWSLKKYPAQKGKKILLNRKKIILAPDRVDNYSLRVYVGGEIIVINKVLFRQKYGRRIIGSNNFVVRKIGRRYHLKGFGKGHGVGMSQIGAKRLADRGWDYRKILAYYYPGLKLAKMY